MSPYYENKHEQTVTDLTKTVGINDISNGAITSHYDESVQNAFMSSGNSQNGPNIRRDEFIQEEKRIEAESATKPDTIRDGPVNNNKPIDQKDDKPNPKPLKTTWVRLARDIKSKPNEACMFEAESKREPRQIKDPRPTKNQAVRNDETPTPSTTVVAGVQPRRAP